MKQIYKGRVVNLWIDNVTLPNGNHLDLEIIRHPGASTIVPVTKTNEVILIKQYRHAANGFIIEAAAGKLNPGEDPLICARREMIEETGMDAEQINYLTTIYTTPGFTDEIIHLYYATNIIEAKQALEFDEVIEVIKMPIENAIKMIYNKEIIDAKTIITLLLTYSKLNHAVCSI